MVTANQENAKRYLETVRAGFPARRAEQVAQVATSDMPRTPEAVAAFRLQPEPSILVTVAMAYEGLDVPEVAVVAALTHIRSLTLAAEQMVARATRVDPHAGPYETQRALVFHPDDPLFQRFDPHGNRPGTLARVPKRRRTGKSVCRSG